MCVEHPRQELPFREDENEEEYEYDDEHVYIEHLPLYSKLILPALKRR